MTRWPQHSHLALQALCCLYPPSSPRCWPGYSTSASSATASSPRARAGWGCGGGGQAAAGRQRATGSSRSPARGRRPGTYGRPCSRVSTRVGRVHGPRYAAAAGGRGSRGRRYEGASLTMRRRDSAGLVRSGTQWYAGTWHLAARPPASWERTRMYIPNSMVLRMDDQFPLPHLEAAIGLRLGYR